MRFIVLTGLVLASCQPAPSVVPTTTPTHLPTQTPTIPPPTETPRPSPILSPSPSPTPQRPTLDPISIENIQNLREEAILGEGKLADVTASEQAGLIAYVTQIGIRLLDSQTLAQRTFLESTIPVALIEFSPDGMTLAAGYESGFLRLFAVDQLLQGQEKPYLEIKSHNFQITALKFSPDGSLLASGSRDRTVNLWKVKDGAKFRPLGGFELAISDMAFSADSLNFAAASLDGTIRVWEIKSGKMLNQTGIADKKRLQTALYPARIIFYQDSSTLWIGWANGDLDTWNWQKSDASPQSAGKLTSGLVDLLLKSDQSLLSLDDHGQVDEWQVTTDSLLQKQTIKTIHNAKGIAVLTSNTLVIGSYPARVERLVLTGLTPVLLYERPNLASQVTSVVFSPDEHLFITGSGDGILRIWDADQPNHPMEWSLEPGTAIQSLVITPDNQWLAVAYGTKVDMFAQADVLTAIQSSIQNVLPHPKVTITTSGTAHRISLSSDGKWLAVSLLLANHIQLYSLPDGKELGELTEFEHPVEALAFSPTENTLAAGAKDHRVYVWSVQDLASLQPDTTDKTFKPAYIKGGYVVTSLVWSPAGDQISISGTLKQAHVNNPADGQVLYYLNNATDQLTCAAFSPDGSLIASSGVDGILRLYETKHGKLLAELSGHSGMINTILFSPSGDRIITGGEDGTLRLWSIPTSE